MHVEKKTNQNLRRIKFYEKQYENDQGSNRGKMCFVFCGGPPLTILASPASLNFFGNPEVHLKFNLV
mgnify:CR=1 FL=1